MPDQPGGVFAWEEAKEAWWDGNWASGEPDSAPGMYADCVALLAGKFEDIGCYNEFPYLCERAPSP